MFTAENPLSYLTKKHVIKEAKFLEAGLENVVLKYGHWFIAMAGAGGCGGGCGSGSAGGAGGYGNFTVANFSFNNTTRAQIYIGTAGKTYTNGGNGGYRGQGNGYNQNNGGYGGGAGKPTYLTFYNNEQLLYAWGSEDIYTRTNEVKTTSIIYGKNGEVNTSWSIEKIEDIENSTYKNVTFKYVTGDTLTISSQNTTVINSVNLPFYIYANGGGGGGGGAGYGLGGRYCIGGGGGGGAGYFRFDYDNLTLIVDIPGKKGGNGSNQGGYGPGTDGNTDDFSNVKAGRGGNGHISGGGAAGIGGGASGGGGGGGGNHRSAQSGGGGGGAPGDNVDAGGGFGSGGGASSGESGTNPHIIPTSVAVRNMKYGIPENLGRGGAGSSTANTEGEEGNNGWVYLLRYEDINSIIDCQLITDTSVSTIMDLGILGQDITQQQDMGHI